MPKRRTVITTTREVFTQLEVEEIEQAVRMYLDIDSTTPLDFEWNIQQNCIFGLEVRLVVRSQHEGLGA